MSRQHGSTPLGATPSEDGSCWFCVWAPNAAEVSVILLSSPEREIHMTHERNGYHTAQIPQVSAGTRYWYRLGNGPTRPDPASRFQPFGVHGPSEVVSGIFAWSDGHWRGIPLHQYILYELHVGTFTPEGTFDAIIPHLEALVALGITAIELMPIAQFPGHRNWGYDGVYPYAAQSTYGGVQGLKRLVDACHARGLAVTLDVVYNHLGPEGNYLRDFGPYFTDRYKTPWGASLNFDGAGSDHVRRFFIENALYWIRDCHIDSLRLDATQAMADLSAYTVLDELVETVHRQRDLLNRRIYLKAETDRSDDRLLRPQETGGTGMDAQWSDEFHHAIHVTLTGETISYYRGWDRFSSLVRAVRHGFVYAGEYSDVHGRSHGTFRTDLPAGRFVVCAQNHDHVGNRKNGDRLGHLVSFDALKLAAGLTLLSPYVPLLFMGEEYAEDSPFLFFTSFGDRHLREAVRLGRVRDFEEFFGPGETPDPEEESTFQASKLHHADREAGQHGVLLRFYTELIRLRKSTAALSHLDKTQMEVIGFERQRVIFMRRWHGESDVCILFNAGSTAANLTIPIPEGNWVCVLNSASTQWSRDSRGEELSDSANIESGTAAAVILAPLSVTVYVKTDDDA